MMSILLMLHMCKDKGMHFSLPNYKKEAWQYPNSQTSMVIQTLNVFYRRQTFIPQKKLRKSTPVLFPQPEERPTLKANLREEPCHE